MSWHVELGCGHKLLEGSFHRPAAHSRIVGLGDRATYPDLAACDLVADALNSLPSRDAAARPWLLGRAERARPESVAPDFKLNAVQTFRNYVPERIVELVYETVPDDGAIWRVGFTGDDATFVGRDD